MDLIRIGRRRRKKELIRVSAIVFLVSFFLAAFLLYHSQMQEYESQRNIRLCGSWILEKGMFFETPKELHPYVKKLGEVNGGVHVYYDNSGDVYENDTGLFVGELPDNMPDIGRVRIFDGRLPQNEGEIALTLGALEKLGLSYELGQQVNINYGEYYSHSQLKKDKSEQVYHTKSYVVTGILYNYFDMWNTGDGMPSVIISSDDFDKLDAQKMHLGFYGLKSEYADVDTEFTNALMAGDDTIHYNSNVYDAVLWDSGITNVWVVMSVMIIGCCAMAYIIIQENKRRKNCYYRMRCIGATKGQIRAFSMQESVLTIVPAAIVGIIAAYIICAAAEIFVSVKEDIGYFFTFDISVFLRIIGAVFVTMLVSLIVSQSTLMRSRIIDGEEKISVKRADRLRKSILRAGLTDTKNICTSKTNTSGTGTLRTSASEINISGTGMLRTSTSETSASSTGAFRKKAFKPGKHRLITPSYTAKRINAMHPVRTILLRVVGIAVCSMVLYNITKTFEDISYYGRVRAVCKDFVIDMPDEYRYKIQYEDKENNSVTTTDAIFKVMDNGLTDMALKSIELVDGIERVDYISEESIHKLSWDGMKDSQVYNDMVDMFCENGRYDYDDIYGQIFCEVYYDNTARIWNDFAANIEWDGADYEKFCNGEQVLAVGDISRDATFTPGTIVHIETAAGNIDVEVAAVIPFEQALNYIDQGNGGCDIVGSDVLGRKVAAADSREFRYTQAEIFFDGYRDAEFIAQQLSIIAVRSGGKYKAEYTTVKQQYNSLMHKLFMYGGFVIAVFFMYAVIRMGILKDEAAGLAATRTRLKQVGADDGFIVRQAVSGALKEGASFLISIPVVTAVYGFIYVKDAIDTFNSKNNYVYMALRSERLNRWFEYEPNLKASIKFIPIKLLDLQFEWYLLFIVVVTALFVAVSVIMTKSELRISLTK